MFVVFDVETTGLSTTSCDIVQFAYIMFDSNNMFVKAENLYYYYEGMSWSDEAEAVHGLSREFLKQYEDQFRANLLKMYSVLNRCNVVGHNAVKFDCPFVKNWLSRFGLSEFQFGIQQDTMTAFKPITKRSRIKLTALSELMGVKPEFVKQFADDWFKADVASGAHDATYDVTATALLTLRGIAKNLISFKPAAALMSAEYDADLEEDVASVMSTSKPVDPKGYCISLVELTGASTLRYVCHDRRAYAEPADLSTVPKFPAPFTPVPGTNTYTSMLGDITFTYVPGPDDKMLLKSDFFSSDDTAIDVLVMINKVTGNVKEEDV